MVNTRHFTLPVIDANQLMGGSDGVEVGPAEEERADDLNGESFDSLQQSLNDTFRIHLTIIADFWAKFSGKLLHNWHEFFVSSETMYLQDINNEMTTFIRDALKITKFELVRFGGVFNLLTFLNFVLQLAAENLHYFVGEQQALDRVANAGR